MGFEVQNNKISKVKPPSTCLKAGRQLRILLLINSEKSPSQDPLVKNDYYIFIRPSTLPNFFPSLFPQILGGLYNPSDGHIDPYSLTMAFAKGARKYGAQLYQKTTVTALNLNGDGIWTLETNQGPLRARHVVNAAGKLALPKYNLNVF